jgi:hypothetical protein
LYKLTTVKKFPNRFVSLDSYAAGDTFPYWERENTGDPELFAQEYIDYCINNLYPDVGCPGEFIDFILCDSADNTDNHVQAPGTALHGGSRTTTMNMITQSSTFGLLSETRFFLLFAPV